MSSACKIRLHTYSDVSLVKILRNPLRVAEDGDEVTVFAVLKYEGLENQLASGGKLGQEVPQFSSILFRFKPKPD